MKQLEGGNSIDLIDKWMIHVIWRLASRLSTRSLPSGRLHIPRETDHTSEKRATSHEASGAHFHVPTPVIHPTIQSAVPGLSIVFWYSFTLSFPSFFLFFFFFFFLLPNRWNLIWHRVERRFDKLSGRSWSSTNRLWSLGERITCRVVRYWLLVE